MNNAQVAAMLPAVPPVSPVQAQESEDYPIQTSPQANILSPGIPGAPPMISVDTSEDALRSQGLGKLQQPVRSAMKRSQGQPQTGGSPYGGNVRVNVIREP